LERYRSLLIEWLTRLGAKVEMVEGDPRPAWLDSSGQGGAVAVGAPVVIASRQGRERGPRVLLAGHLDTVHDPHGSFRELTVENATIARGPGAADMKGGVLIALCALKALDAAGVDLNWTVL